ncbi:MAG TPA: PAS domain-containing protein [Nannocystis sp.]
MTDDALAPTLSLQGVLDALADPIFVKDRALRFTGCNEALCALLGRTREEIVGRTDPEMFPPDQVEVFRSVDERILATGEPFRVEEWLSTAAGLRRIMTRKFPLRDDAGAVSGLCGVITDITEQHERQLAADQVVADQRDRLAQLSVPVLQIWDGTLLLPLIGELDDERAAQVRDSLLVAVNAQRARVVLIDVTGLLELGPSTAQHLLAAVRGCSLLGCRSILVGVRPELALALVTGAVDLHDLPTRLTLQEGLATALAWLGARVSAFTAGDGP